MLMLGIPFQSRIQALLLFIIESIIKSQLILQKINLVNLNLKRKLEHIYESKILLAGQRQIQGPTVERGIRPISG